MRKLLYIILLAAGVFAIGCKKEGLNNFNGDNLVYFAFADSAKLDTTVVSFGYAPASIKDSVFKVRVKTMGYMSSSDRTYKLGIIPEYSTAQAGVHYDALPGPYSVKAGRIDDTVLLKLHRTPDMQTKSVVVALTLMENENFTTNYRYTNLLVYVNDILTQPKYWLATYLGTFSRKKINLMSQVLGISIADINSNSVIAQMIYWGRFTQLYLNDMKAQGQPVYEDDGVTPMVMGPSVQ